MKTVVFLLTLMVGLGPAAAATPTIEIQGLPGAEHWIWFEAEDALFDSTNAGPLWRDSFSISAGNRNPDAVFDQWQAGGGWVKFRFTPPAAMTAARMFVRYGSSATLDSSVLVNESPRGTLSLNASAGEWAHPTTLDVNNPVNLGSLSRTANILKFVHPGTYCERTYDAILIYDGANADPCNATTNYGPNQWGPYYMYPPASSAAPVIGPAAKPVVVFHNRTNEEYAVRIRKDDGPWRNFVSGSVLEEPGDYQLVAYVTNGTSYYFSGYAGANFALGGAGFCGSSGNPIPPGDMNADCVVDILDLSLFAAQWLKCNDPLGPCD